MVNQPQVKKVIGSVKLAEKMAQFDAKKFAEIQKESGAPSKKRIQKLIFCHNYRRWSVGVVGFLVGQFVVSCHNGLNLN